MKRRLTTHLGNPGSQAIKLLSILRMPSCGSVAIIGAFAFTPNAAHGETKVAMTPSFAVETTATIGSAVVEKSRYETLQVAVADTDVIRGTITGKIKIRADDPLTQVSSNAKFKACSTQGPCGLDDDGDGTFDRIALDASATALTLKAPVPYHLKDIISSGGTGNFKQIVSYLGVSGDTLRLSYREFSNDMARLAFTEELTFPLGKTFPQGVAFKDVKMTIMGIDRMGMRYRLER